VTDDRWQRLEEKITDIQAGIAEIRTIYDAHSRAIERMERTLFGNGSTGLCTKVSAILWMSSAIAGFVAVLLAQAIASWVGRG
jgi:hypothetical protein